MVFGVAALIWPAQALSTLVIVFAAYALVDGAAAVSSSILGVGGVRLRWWLGVAGLLGIATGVATFVWPDLAARLVIYLIAGWAVALGALQIIGAIMLRREIESEWLLMLGGAVSVFFGGVLFFMPDAGVVDLVWIVAIYALLYGTVLVGLAAMLKGHIGDAQAA